MPRRPHSVGYATMAGHFIVFIAVSAVMGLLAAGLLIPFAGAIGLGANAAANSVNSLPLALRNVPLSQRSVVLSANGTTIATFYNQNRVVVPYSKMAPIMRKAVVAIEDSRYYQHGAIDLKGTIRAFVTNQTNGGITQGGSTITQQLAKMTELDQATTKAQQQAATADTYQRKFLELRHALALEESHSKSWILTRYLNIAYFGDGAYGVQAAAEHFFSTSAAKLTVPEAALIAGLVQNPTAYDPRTQPDMAIQRRNIVLERMAQLHVISQATATRDEGRGLGLNLSYVPNGCVSSRAPFFCDYVRRYLLADPSLGRTVGARQRLLDDGGLTIRTTVRLPFQKAADIATRTHVSPTDRAIGALAEVQPGTGNVFAISQSRPMGSSSRRGQTYIDYAVPRQYGGSGGFQAGSTFKLFVLASALGMGLPTSTSFDAPPHVSLPEDTFPDCSGNYPSTGVWSVNNSTISGYMNMVTGTQESVNTFYAQLERKVGLCQPYALAKAMGVPLTDPANQRVPSFTLGVVSVNPLTMAAAYATPAARGLYCAPRAVTEILNSKGQVFKRYPTQCRQVMTANTADTINQILAGVMSPGGFGALLVLDKPSAGKTGTTDNDKSAWFDGYTPEVATASMVAGANRVGHPISLNGQTLAGQYVAVAHGSTVAGPMWYAAMHPVQDRIPRKAFVPPTGATTTQTHVSVPSVIGMSVARAQATLQSAGFQVLVANSIQSHVGHGRVASTSPQPGDPAYSGSMVFLFPAR